jgi:tetratricopeptide (TPR) repeat protein
MKQAIVWCGILFLVSTIFGLPVEKTIEQKIAELEQKLAAASGKRRVEILNDLVNAHTTHSPQKGLEYGRQALALSRKIGYREEEANALLNIGWCHVNQGDSKQALANWQQSLKIFKDVGHKRGIAAALNGIGLAERDFGNYDKALEHYLEAAKIQEEIGNKDGLAAVLINIGTIYWYVGNHDKALEYYRKSAKIYEEIGNKQGLTDSLSGIGNVYIHTSQYDKALEYHLKSAKIQEEMGHKKGLATTLHNIGTTYFYLENYDKAREYYLKTSTLHEELGDRRGMATSLNGMAVLYHKLDQNDKAFEYFHDALKVKEELGDKSGVAQCLHNIGTIYGSLKQYDRALEYVLKALKIREEIGEQLGVARSLANIGSIYKILDNYDRASSYYLRSLKLAQEIKYKETIKTVSNDLAGLYEAQGHYRKALEYHRLYHKTDREILNEQNMKQINELQARYESEKKEKEIEVLKRNNQIQELRLAKARFSRNASIVGFILVLIILGLLFKKYLYLFAFWKKQKYIGHFRLMDKIGSGAMGTIYRAKSLMDKSTVAAVKVLKEELFTDENSKKRFKQEATIIDKLEHPHIVKIIERGEYRETLFTAMEFLEGKTLEQKIIEEGTLNLEVCLHIMAQVADALAFIHGKNVIHRDIKPANIMLVEEAGDPHFVKLLDFGLARMEFQTRLTLSGNFLGTIEYVAPEQILRTDSSPANDVFALGVTFYKMLCSTPPFPGETVLEIMRQIIGHSPPAISTCRPDAPPDLDTLVMKMLAKDPTNRPSADDILNTLRHLNVSIPTDTASG